MDYDLFALVGVDGDVPAGQAASPPVVELDGEANIPPAGEVPLLEMAAADLTDTAAEQSSRPKKGKKRSRAASVDFEGHSVSGCFRWLENNHVELEKKVADLGGKLSVAERQAAAAGAAMLVAEKRAADADAKVLQQADSLQALGQKVTGLEQELAGARAKHESEVAALKLAADAQSAEIARLQNAVRRAASGAHGLAVKQVDLLFPGLDPEKKKFMTLGHNVVDKKLIQVVNGKPGAVVYEAPEAM